MARGLGMEVLAEGIETREQAEFLHSVGCSNLQGYLFSKPVSAVDFQDFVSREAAGAVDATGDSFEVAEGA